MAKILNLFRPRHYRMEQHLDRKLRSLGHEDCVLDTIANVAPEES